MSFLASTPDLTSTIFTDENLRFARQYLESGIVREDPAWLKKPQGILGEYWMRDNIDAACFLIDVARMIHLLDTKVAEKSIPRLYAKVRALLRPPSPEQFVENLTELQVAFLLAERVSPLVLLESQDILEPQVTRAPDLGFKTAEGIVFVEVSVFHGGVMDTWTRSVQYIQTSLQNFLFKRNRMLSVRIGLPLKAEMSPQQIASLVLKEISQMDTGRVRIGSKGFIEWEPCPIITVEDIDDLPTEFPASFGVIHSPGAVVDRAFVSQTQIIFASEEDMSQAKEAVLKGLRQKLREKRDQFLPKTEREPSILAMRLEHNQLGAGDIAAMLEERIWPNKEEYDWLTGVALFQPRKGFQTSDESMTLTLYPNPYTIRPMTDSLLALFNGTATFHSN